MNELQVSNFHQARDEFQSNSSTTNVIPRSKSAKSCNPIVFRKELTDCIFLILKVHNRQFRIHKREFKRSGLTNEEILIKWNFYEC